MHAHLNKMSRPATSSSSSIQSSNYHLASSSSSSNFRTDLSTDLSLGLTINSSSAHQHHQHTAPSLIISLQGSEHQWPAPSKKKKLPALRQSVEEEEEEEEDDDDDEQEENQCNSASTFFVKVYMEGIPIGRKLDLLAHHGYRDLIMSLDHMFNTAIFWAEDEELMQCEKSHVLTYEDKEGDWMMVGDVPWKMFLSTVRRLKITRAYHYQQ